MSRGTRHTTIRLSPAMLERINGEVARLNSRLKTPKWNLTEFIRMAVLERLDKLERGRKGRQQRRANGADQDAGDGEPASQDAGDREQSSQDAGDQLAGEALVAGDRQHDQDAGDQLDGAE